MDDLDRMITLATTFGTNVLVTKDCAGNYLVSIHRVSYKNSIQDVMDRYLAGRGQNLQIACADFLKEASGKIIFGNDPIFYGKHRPEYICI